MNSKVLLPQGYKLRETKMSRTLPARLIQDGGR